MTTDAEILDLLAAANPRPPDSGRVPPPIDLDAVKRRDPAVALTGGSADRRIPTGRRWRTLIAAAAVVAIVIAGILLLRPSEDPTPLDPVPAPTTTAPPPSFAATETALEFMAARNDYDAERALELVAPGVETLDLASAGSGMEALALEDLRLMWDRYRAYGWTSENIECSEARADAATVEVVCTTVDRNSLSDYMDVDPFAGTSRFTIADNGIVTATRTYDLSLGFSDDAWNPFILWAASEHPDETTEAWSFDPDGVRPVLTDEGNAAFGRHVDEFTTGDEPPSHPTRRFIDARSGDDTIDVTTLLDPDTTIDDLWISSTDGYDAAADFFAAFGWTWETIRCGLANPDTGPETTTVACLVRSNSRVLTGLGPSGEISTTVTPDGITGVQANLSPPYPDAFSEWHDWLRSEHPDEISTLYGDSGDDWIPNTTPEALALFDTRSREFAAAR